VLAVPDEPARGRKPVLRDELAAVVVKQQYPPERLPLSPRVLKRAIDVSNDLTLTEVNAKRVSKGYRKWLQQR
ncbi:MAG: hypothetical protein JXA30_04535, partial [Deltaproteobacteria bacterium]|nr:hypothetical protein [Deltaproteobacteria bacterium]